MAASYPLHIFSSPSNPSHQVHYRHLNPDVRYTLLFCYGAGASSLTIFNFDSFIQRNPSLSILCIDRWTLPATGAPQRAPQEGTPTDVVSRSGTALFSELSNITLELLDSLKIQKLSIAAHSGGAYQMLDLATKCRETGRITVQNLFPICTHIPEPYVCSKMLRWMSTMPNFLFDTVTKLDSSLGDSAVARWLSPSKGAGDLPDSTVFLSTPGLRQQLARYEPTWEELSARKERQLVDYRMLYSRLPGIDQNTLFDLYKKLPLLLSGDLDVTWFTCEADNFFGPPSVQRILKAVGSNDRIEMIAVEGASHADIYLRSSVWESMYEHMARDQ